MLSSALAMSIDYSLFLLSRFREEVEGGATPDAAVATMMASAGHTVLVSGSTLTLCFLGLLLFPVEFLGMMGLGAAFSVGMCVLVNLTLTPALLLSFPAFFTAFECGGFGCLRRGAPAPRADGAAPPRSRRRRRGRRRRRRAQSGGGASARLRLRPAVRGKHSAVGRRRHRRRRRRCSAVHRPSPSDDDDRRLFSDGRGATARRLRLWIDDFGSGASRLTSCSSTPRPAPRSPRKTSSERPTTCCATLPTRPQRRRGDPSSTSPRSPRSPAATTAT